MTLEERLRAEGYTHVRQLPDGNWIGLYRNIYTVGLYFGLDESGYRYRFCYEHLQDAILAIEQWNGLGSPPGPWIKEKGERGEWLGPGASA